MLNANLLPRHHERIVVQVVVDIFYNNNEEKQVVIDELLKEILMLDVNDINEIEAFVVEEDKTRENCEHAIDNTCANPELFCRSCVKICKFHKKTK